VKRTKAGEHFIACLEKALIRQNELGEIEPGGSAAWAAGFRHEIDWRVVNRVEDRFSVVAEGPVSAFSKLCGRAVKLVVVVNCVV
jgi:hypothetical protein